MNNIKETYQTSPVVLLSKINEHLGENRKKQIKFVILLSLLSSIAESVSVALLIPLINFFTSSESNVFHNVLNFLFNLIDVNSKDDNLKIVSIFFIIILVFSGFIRIKYLKFSHKLTEEISSDFRIKIFNFLLRQEYNYYFKHGSKDILSNLAQKHTSFVSVIFAAINILNATLISIAILIVLIFNEPIYTLVIIFLTIIFFCFIFFFKSSLVLKKGQEVSLNQNKIIDIYENTVGYLPEITIYNLKKIFSFFFIKVSKDTARAVSDIRIIASTPKVYFEVFILTFVIILLFMLEPFNNNMALNISYLAALAYGAQKILPLVNSIYQLSINFKASTPIVLGFLKILEKKSNVNLINDYDKSKINYLKFKEKLEIKNLTFYYDKNLPKIFNNFSTIIKKGQKIAIKGQTGSGKSTLVNIISGLLDPVDGRLIVDGTQIDSSNKYLWQQNLAVVPQSVFLSDQTIIENIAIGQKLNEINEKKVKNFAEIAQINDFIEKLPNQYLEKVGERGVRLSGGQRQRIGIARALYREAKIIILDEPTNALDKKTEKMVIDSITSLEKDITIILISHSNDLLNDFDQIIDLDSLKNKN